MFGGGSPLWSVRLARTKDLVRGELRMKSWYQRCCGTMQVAKPVATSTWVFPCGIRREGEYSLVVLEGREGIPLWY